MSDNRHLLGQTASLSCARGHDLAITGEVQHTCCFSEQIGSLCLNEDYSDVRLIVSGTSLPAHRVILAARSDYFRALLFGGMRESSQREVQLNDTSIPAFKLLLKYIYSGCLMLANLKEDLLMDLLGLAHKYGFTDLESSLSNYFKVILTVSNVCTILSASFLFSLTKLTQHCLEFVDRCALEVLVSDGFLNLSAVAVKEIISRDSFFVPEIEVFNAMRRWARANQAADFQEVLSAVRLPLISLDHLLNVVRPSGIVSADVILDAIKVQSEKLESELKYRGYLLPDVNVAASNRNAQVVEGELRMSLLNGDCESYDMERGFTRHLIKDNDNLGIVIQLGSPFIINHIKMLLWDRDERSYSYYIEASMDRERWTRVVDYSDYLCRSWQYLYFPGRVVKYIRVVGTRNTKNNVFHLVSLEAMYSTRVFKTQDGFVVPTENVSLLKRGASVVEGISCTPDALINGDSEHYDWDSGYTCHPISTGAIVIQLPQPFILDTMRLLLWDCDSRKYSYYVEASIDSRNWTMLADKRDEECSSWQHIRFEPRIVVFVKIVGTRNTANEVFHCVYFECPDQSCFVHNSTDCLSILCRV